MRGSLPLLLLTLDIICAPWPRVHAHQAGLLTGVTPSWSAAGSAAGVTAGLSRPLSTAGPTSTASGHHTTLKTASSTGQQVTQTQVRHTTSVGDVLHDDEDPPVSFASPPLDASGSLSGSPSANGVAHTDGADNMDVRSNGAHQQQQQSVVPDASPYHDPAVGGVGLGNEDDDQGHPNWRLVNTKKCGLSKGALADRIVGGFVAGLGQYPWLARIGYNLDGVARRVYRCAGAVITHFHVLTAAHCVKNLPENFEFAGVRLGEWDTTTDPDCQYSVCAPPVYDIDPEFVIVHQDYNNPRFANDIALVKLAQKINFNVCM